RTTSRLVGRGPARNPPDCNPGHSQRRGGRHSVGPDHGDVSTSRYHCPYYSCGSTESPRLCGPAIRQLPESGEAHPGGFAPSSSGLKPSFMKSRTALLLFLASAAAIWYGV